MLQIFKTKAAFTLLLSALLVPILFPQATLAGANVQLRDRAGNLIINKLSLTDRIDIDAPDGTTITYLAGPAYSPKQTCGECHDYNAITRAYHFMNGAKPGSDGMGLSDTWSSENQDGTSYKYLANAYGHLLSSGQFGSW